MRENTDQNKSDYGQFSRGVIPAAVPVDGNESDIGGGSDESDGSNEKETEGDTEKSDSSENEYEEATDSAANGRKGENEGQKNSEFVMVKGKMGPATLVPTLHRYNFLNCFVMMNFFS